MTGANPNTSWFDGCVALDSKGFIRTGSNLSEENLSISRWPLARQPYLLKQVYRVFSLWAMHVQGAGQVKRVASAVGEGSTAISFIHKILQE